MILGYDTETNGFTNDREPPSHPSQPNLVQLACVLFDPRTGDELQSVSMIVRPEVDEKGSPLWTIPKAASDVHGITLDIAMRYGVPLRVAVATFTNLRAVASATVAHNINFDRIVLEAAIHRCNGKPAHPGPNVHYCTMRTATDIMKLPPSARMVANGRNGFKPPKLIELHQWLFGEGFEGAHNALADILATKRCFVEMFARRMFEEAQPA